MNFSPNKIDLLSYLTPSERSEETASQILTANSLHCGFCPFGAKYPWNVE